MSIDTDVTPALHPQNVQALPGYGEHKAYLAPVETAFSEAYEGLRSIHNARRKARTNPTWNEASQIIHVALFAEKVQDRVSRTIDSTADNLNKGIKALDEMLAGPLEQQAGAGTINQEIRSHTKALSNEDRVKFISGAVKRGDTKTLTAVLGAPAYLSGLSDVEHHHHLRAYNISRAPDVAKRLEAMKAARDLLHERAPLLFKEIEKGIGSNWQKVQRLRQAKSEAEQAFVLKDDA